MDSLVLQTAIGLVFVFAAFAAFISVLTEGITRFMGLRGEYLLRGIRTLVDGDSKFSLSIGDIFRRKDGTATEPGPHWVTKLMANPLLRVSADKADLPANAGSAKLSGNSRRKLPSYISGRAFSQALIDAIVPDATGTTTMTQIREKIDALPDGSVVLKKRLRALANDAVDDVTKFRSNIEAWYDAHMDRVSGWYKRHVRWILLGIGALAVLLFNLNVLSIGRSLYSDQALRGSLVTEATQASNCGTKDPATCLRDLRTELDHAQTAGLPIGWGTVTQCAATKCNWFDRVGLVDRGKSAGHNVGVVLLVVIGWSLMVVALLPGARFWFDLLSRLGSLRSTGPKPAKI
jgi:hypothetical protein